MTVFRALPQTAPPKPRPGERPDTVPTEAESTTSVRCGCPALVEDAEVISPGQVRTDTIAAPAGKPVSVYAHSGVPVWAEYPEYGQPGAEGGDTVADRHVGQARRRHGAGQPGNHLPRPHERLGPPDDARHGPAGSPTGTRPPGSRDRAERGVRQQGDAEQDQGQRPAAQPRGGTRGAQAIRPETAREARRRIRRATRFMVRRRDRLGDLAPRLSPHDTTVGETGTKKAASDPSSEVA